MSNELNLFLEGQIKDNWMEVDLLVLPVIRIGFSKQQLEERWVSRKWFVNGVKIEKDKPPFLLGSHVQSVIAVMLTL